MRIAHIVNSLEMGGAEVVAISLCRAHRRLGHEVSVHCLFRMGPLGEQVAAEGLPVFVHSGRGRLATMRNIYRAFRADRWDVGHCHNVVAAVWAAPMLRAAGMPTVVATRHSLVKPPYDFGNEVQFSIAARFCSSVVGVCHATTENIARAPLADSSRITTVYNGAAPPRAAGERPSKDGFTFVCVARLAPPKDHETLLRAFVQTRRDLPAASLWIVGDGPLRAALEKLAVDLRLGGSVVFCGERLNPGDFLAAADAFVLSSRSEGVPMSLLEAMSAGLPTIVTDVGGMAEVVRRFDLGPVVRCGEIDALASAMIATASDPAALAAGRDRARDAYRRHFTIDAMAEAYLRLYRGPGSGGRCVRMST